MKTHSFPPRFLWGVATSAPQIEGAVREDGRGESIWDRFAATPGRIADGSDPSVACDHYHLWREDVALMKTLGVGAYRFSIAWPRILPEGRGEVNARGLDFYDALVDELLGAGIQPFVTLYHWDLPQALEERGGWGARETIDAFAEYTAAVAGRLGDRVRYWVTHNEPWCTATLGHEEGHHAPGHTDPALALRVAHHLLVSHGRAVGVLRDLVPRAEVGIVLNLTPSEPASADPADVDAARQVDGSFNRWYLDPIFRARYPADAVADRVRRGHLSSAFLPFVQTGDLDVISAPLDFLGVNYYSRAVVRGVDGVPEAVNPVPPEELTDMGWEVHPRGLHDLLVRVTEDYRPPKIFITENGVAYGDGPNGTGRIADERRIAFLRDHLLAVRRARRAGAPIAGYFTWSLMDNFEWAHGYAKRFGIYWVDFETQKRLPKESASWYRQVVSTNAVSDATSHATVRRFP
jgi:beta-glucosidase